MSRLELSRSAFHGLEQLAGDVGADVRADYSGRGMYGSQCLALVCDGVSDLVQFTLALAEALAEAVHSDDETAEEVSQLVDVLRTAPTRADQLGLGQVYYWPGVEVAS